MTNKILKNNDSCRIIVRQEKQKELLLEQIHKIPIIQLACEKLGISRSTIYRWKDEDKEFDRKMIEALNKGKTLINDIAESKLIVGIQNGNMTSVIYWLKHNHKNYREKKPSLFKEDIEPIQLTIVRYDPKYHNKNNSTVQDDKDKLQKVKKVKTLSGNYIEIKTRKNKSNDND